MLRYQYFQLTKLLSIKSFIVAHHNTVYLQFYNEESLKSFIPHISVHHLNAGKPAWLT